MFVDWTSEWHWVMVGGIGIVWALVTALIIILAAWPNGHPRPKT